MKSNLRGAAMALAVLLLSMITGCQSYEPNPINWDAVSSQWNQTLFQTDVDLDGALQFALALNPDINTLRLKNLSSKKHAAEAGWWEDPAFGFEALRVLNGAEHPQLGGFGFSFTLPVNGVPKLRTLAAERYSDADRLAVEVAERNLSMRVVQCWSSILCAKERVALLEQTLERHSKLSHSVNGLVEAGELDKNSGDRLMLAQIERKYALDSERRSLDQRHAALMALMGVHPRAGLNLKMSREAMAGWESYVGISNDLDLVSHPSVREQLVKLDATEQDLRIELRRQYPDIEIGPRYGYEGGTDRLGFDAGLTLPLWNRNRRGIAAAEGARDMRRSSALARWKELVQRYYMVQLALAKARRRVSLLESERIPAVRAIVARIEALFERGESDISSLLEAEHSLFEARLELLNVRERLALNLVELRFLGLN